MKNLNDFFKFAGASLFVFALCGEPPYAGRLTKTIGEASAYLGSQTYRLIVKENFGED